MFESLNYRGLRETVLLTDCMMVRGSHSPLVASLRCSNPAVSVATSVDGYTTKLCILVVIMLFVWVCFCVCVDESVHRGGGPVHVSFVHQGAEMPTTYVKLLEERLTSQRK